MNKLTESEVENIRKRELLTIGEFIKRKRTKQNATQNDVADVLGVSNAEVSYYESGSRDMPISSFSVIGECLDFKLKDYVLEIEPTKAVRLFEGAIYREAGKEKGYKMQYMAYTGHKDYSYTNNKKDVLSNTIEVYFERDTSENDRRTLVLADMLYNSVSDKSSMKSVYKSIVRDIADTGDRRMNAVFREYISIIRNER